MWRLYIVPCLFSLYSEHITRNARLDEAQAGINVAGRNINNLRYADDTTLMAESEDELKSLFMKVKEVSEKVGLKLSIQKTKIVASGPITSWQRDWETMETVRDFILVGFKITADGDCSHEIKRLLLLGRKIFTNLDSILKRRNITLPAKVHLVKAMVFPVFMYGRESWIIKKAEHWRFDAILWNSPFKWVSLTLSPLPLASLLFSAMYKASSDNHFAFWISFLGGWSWSLPPIQCHESPFIVLQALSLSDLIRWIYLSLPLHNHKGFDLGQT